MRRALVPLAALALVGALAANVAAQRPPIGQSISIGDTRQKPDCGELAQLRHELARLHQELRQLEIALAQAKHSGNRERAREIMQEIRRVQAEIQDVQQKIRRLDHVCRG